MNVIVNVEGHGSDRVVVVKASERRIDASRSEEFKARLFSLVCDGVAGLVLDISDVEFIDSSGLGAIIATLEELAPNGEIALCGTRESVKSILRLTRMDCVFHHCEAPEAAFDLISG